MKLLFDENLSRKLVDRLADLYPESAHVVEFGLLESSDREIWEVCQGQGFPHRQHRLSLLRTRNDHRAASQSRMASALDAPDQGRGTCVALRGRPNNGMLD